MTKKEEQPKLYKNVSNHPRREKGEVVQVGGVVSLDHLTEADIKMLLTLGYYREV